LCSLLAIQASHKKMQTNQNINQSLLLDYEDLIKEIDNIDVKKYAQTRNYLNGAVSKLSPFITHGILTTKEITCLLLKRELETNSLEVAYRRIEPFIFQMAWRDYFHRAWEYHNDDIFSNLRHEQTGVISHQIPTAILDAQTGINVIDDQLSRLYQTGYIHNHARMWIAALVSNITGTDWRNAASWFHYHLIDGDLASNTLSWQWVAGTLNKNKKQYVANQDNINKYANSEQRGTILDCSYDDIKSLMPFKTSLEKPNQVDYSLRDDWQIRHASSMSIPDSVITTPIDELRLQDELPVFLRNFYQLDESWNNNAGQHILLIEPSMLIKYPLSEKRWAFIEHWALKIPSLKIIIADFTDFQEAVVHCPNAQIIYRNHPLSQHWHGVIQSRSWLFDGLEGDYPSFFKFWNKAQKQINQNGIANSFELD